MADKELTSNAYCIGCSARIPVYELMCSSCKRKFPVLASRAKLCSECGRPYFVPPTAEQVEQERLEKCQKQS